MTDDRTDDEPDEGTHLDAPPPPAGALDRARDAALSAFDELHADPGGVTDLGDARARRGRHRRVPLGAVAAAVVVLALVGVFALADIGSEIDEMATGADDSAESADDGAETSEDEVSADAGSGASERADGSERGRPDDLQAGPGATYAGVDELVEDLRGRFGPTPSSGDSPRDATTEDFGATTTTTVAAGPRCDALAAAGVDADAAVAVVLATVDGRAVTAVVYRRAGEVRVAIVDRASCTVDDDRTL